MLPQRCLPGLATTPWHTYQAGGFRVVSQGDSLATLCKLLRSVLDLADGGPIYDELEPIVCDLDDVLRSYLLVLERRGLNYLSNTDLLPPKRPFAEHEVTGPDGRNARKRQTGTTRGSVGGRGSSEV